MHEIKIIIDVIDWVLRIFGFISVLSIFILAARGVIQVIYRIGFGISKSKIAIFCKNNELKTLLLTSKIFLKKNIIEIDNENCIDTAKSARIFLVNWSDFKNHINDILHIKEENVALVIYARPGEIDQALINEINKKGNAVIVNMRGRLMNDVFTALITAGYGK
jgi:hypothetical protein